MENIPTKTGVLLDLRSQYEISKDYLHEEIAMGFDAYQWEERPHKSKYFFAYDQSSSLSCVAGGGAILIEYYDKVISSRKDIYGRRANYPGGGMMMNDLLTIISKGVANESSLPSQGLNEAKMNERYTVTTQIIADRAKNRTGKFFAIQNCGDIDTIASVLKICPVVAFWFFDNAGQEWWREYPIDKFNFKAYDQAGVTRHQVTIVDAILIGGKKYLVGQDSAGVGSGLGEDNNLRLISEDMVSKRLYSASYALDDDNEVLNPIVVQKPKFTATATMQVGSRGNSVTQLQNVLIYEGLLNIKSPTGVFAGLTRSAVIAYQQKYRSEILDPIGLKAGTGIVASRTLQHMRKLYN